MRAAVLIPLASLTFMVTCGESDRPNNLIGVVYAVHGGMKTFSFQGLWDNAIQMFAHDQNHPVSKFVIWTPEAWPLVLKDPFVDEYREKYRMSYERLGGTDPYTELVAQQLQQLANKLIEHEMELGKQFLFEQAGWIVVGDDFSTYSHPRSICQTNAKSAPYPLYCGEEEDSGAWPNCDPQRYNVDGPFEKLLAAGVGKILLVDLIVGGVRFSKTFDIYRAGRKLVTDWNTKHRTDVTITWVNDPTDLMLRSYPTEPTDWTRSLGLPSKDQEVSLEDSSNPVAENPTLAEAHAANIAAAFNSEVALEKTGVIFFNHALFDNNEVFDPKVNDTLNLDDAIEAKLVSLFPELPKENILGAYMGIKQINPTNGRAELTRAMRGENLGHFYLYESDKQHPTGKWGYFYWDALETLKERGMQHIVIAFPQVVTDSSLNIFEVPNLIAKEIGYRTHRSNPVLQGYLINQASIFADYWGNWVQTDCGGVPCCFEMGGCDDGRPYPPERQTPESQTILQTDPSLAFDISAYGHLGYDPTHGKPNPDEPVQNQYTGTWSMAAAPNTDTRLSEVMTEAVLIVMRTFE